MHIRLWVWLDGSVKYSLESTLAHQSRNLACGNIDGRASHETANGGRRNELDYPTQAQEAEAQNNETADESNCRRDLRR